VTQSPILSRLVSALGEATARPQLAWGDAEPLAEQSREMHRVFKTATVGDVANLLLTRVIAGERIVSALQTELAHIIDHGLALCGEYTIEMGARTVEFVERSAQGSGGGTQVWPDESFRAVRRGARAP
jgi:hypothetical protein